ncbi:hypothetical protein BFS86_19560 [Shewanella algae]|nr:hypothetical protein BFS86_19560 [Shewanella algae]
MKALPTPFFDLAMGVVFALLATIVVMEAGKPKKAEEVGIPTKAEFSIQMTWDDGSADDMDLYVRGPTGEIVFFGKTRNGYMTYDQDNMGRNNTVIQADGSTIESKSRQETVTLRAIVPGEYVVNAHQYRKNSAPEFVDHVTIRVTKLNPFSNVTQATKEFTEQGQEQTFVNFTITQDGRVDSVYVSPVQLIGAAK